MITEFTLAIIGTYLWNHLNTIDDRKLRNSFKEIMIKIGIKNKDDETFKIYKTIPTSYGYIAYIKNVKGLSVDHLNNKLNILEDNLNGIINIEKDRFKDYIKMQIVNKDISKYKFAPVACSDNNLYLGRDFKGQDYFLDLNKDSQVLIGGATGTGKTVLLSIILTNLIYNSEKDIEIYLFQICKSELSLFENCKPVKFTAYDEQECFIGFNKINDVLDYRSDLFKKHGVRNITQWNNHFPKRKLKRIFCTIEELSFFMDTPELLQYILKIAKTGRSVGIHLITCIQRSTATNLPPDLKSQMTRITFRQKSSIDSSNIINTTDATKLKERECIVDGNSNYELLKTPWIDEDYILLHKYVPDIKIPTDNEKQEIINIKKEDNKIVLIDEPKIIDIDEEEIIELSSHDNKRNSSIDWNKKFKDGVISLEDIKNANTKR